MVRYAKPPVLMQDVIGDVEAVVRVLADHAPYTPLGGWYNPGANPHARTRPMWFQNDWVHDGNIAAGSEIFLEHTDYIEAAKDFYNAEVVVPHSVYVNHMVAIAASGPAHTDNPRFHGRDRANTPMWLLRTMLWSGLFTDFEILQATAIWWMNDTDGGGLYYWADGPDRPPLHHHGAMANTALIGDNHGMFHQVGPVGPFDRGTVRVSPSAELLPVGDGFGDWAVVDQGEIIHQAPLDGYRVSVLWKADVYATEAERQQRVASALSMEDVAAAFNADLSNRGHRDRVDVEALSRADEVAARALLGRIFPEARPVDAQPSVYD